MGYGLTNGLVTWLVVVPLAHYFVFKLFLPWVNKGGAKSFQLTLTFILFNLVSYISWTYYVYSQSVFSHFWLLVLLSLPILLVIVTEAFALIAKKYELLQKINKTFFIVAFVYMFLALTGKKLLSEVEVTNFFIIFVWSVLIQALVYFPSFALLKRKNPKMNWGWRINLPWLSSKDSNEQRWESDLVNKGELKDLTWKVLLITLVKYSGIIFVLWLYSRLLPS